MQPLIILTMCKLCYSARKVLCYHEHVVQHSVPAFLASSVAKPTNTDPTDRPTKGEQNATPHRYSPAKQHGCEKYTQHYANENGTAPGSIAELEEAVKQQGEKVRQLKASTKDKTVWQPEVAKLLDLKKQLEAAQKTHAAQTQGAQTKGAQGDVSSLEKAVAAQADKVRQLKASTKDKTVWQPEVNKLLDLKKQLAAAQSAPAVTQSASANSTDLSALEKELAEQADKVRKLKASTKDKSVWQPEVNKLLAIKKQLADLQINK